MPSSIQVQNLCHVYNGVPVLHDLSFEVDRGQIVGFLGPNGAGKSTTMRILCGLMAATSGKAFVCGYPVSTEAHEVKRRIGYMPENNPLPEDMRVEEYLIYRGRLKEVSGKRLKNRVDEVMELCDLHRTARQKLIGNLSKGFKQRVGIADTLLAEPEVIIMDEPTIGLDPHQVLIIRDLINSLKGKMSIIFSSHILSEVEVSCDKAIIINQGRIVASGSPEELRQTFMPKGAHQVIVEGAREDIERYLNELKSVIRVMNISLIQGQVYKIQFQTDDIALVRKHVSEMIRHHPDWTLHKFSQQRASLEDIFLEATKRSWDIKHGSCLDVSLHDEILVSTTI